MARLTRAAFVDAQRRPIHVTFGFQRGTINKFNVSIAAEFDGDGAPHTLLIDVIRPDGGHGGVLAEDAVAAPDGDWSWGADMLFVPMQPGRFTFRIHLDGAVAGELPADVVDDPHPQGHLH